MQNSGHFFVSSCRYETECAEINNSFRCLIVTHLPSVQCFQTADKITQFTALKKNQIIYFCVLFPH